MVRHQKAVVIQAAVRGWLAQRHYTRLRGAVLYLQCCYRRARARRELRRLRAEARSVEHYKQLHKGMEIKVMQLQCRLDEQVGAVACLGPAFANQSLHHQNHSPGLPRPGHGAGPAGRVSPGRSAALRGQCWVSDAPQGGAGALLGAWVGTASQHSSVCRNGSGTARSPTGRISCCHLGERLGSGCRCSSSGGGCGV